MKPSHLQTPRTRNECVWMSGYQSGPSARDYTDRIVLWACLGACIAVALVFMFFPEAR